MLSKIDQALVRHGHRSIVIAVEGSQTAGKLRPVEAACEEVSDHTRAKIHRQVRSRIADALRDDRPDLIHLHGIDFASYMPPAGPPCLVTLHLPLSWYPPDALRPRRPRTWLHPVSWSQARSAGPGAQISDPVENGVAVGARPEPKQNFAFSLGRICPEKNFHQALDAAKQAQVPLMLAGSVFPYGEHRSYMRSQILPRLDSARRWIGAVAGGRKQKLLAQARCLLVASRAPETSSLVAMEALAAGTPVIAYPSGALPEIVEHGRTGFIVDDTEQMAAAIRDVGAIDTKVCRSEARRRFSLERMISTYFDRYRQVTQR